MDLEELEEHTRKTLDCPLKASATNMVFGKGNPNAHIVFIGEAPGKEEDLQGKPFVGRAGQELDKLLGSIGLNLTDVYIANILKYRPPNNRDPTAEEIERHTPYLIEQLRIIKPRIIITLGNYSTKFVLGGFSQSGMNTIIGISALHGKEQRVNFEDLTLRVVPMYHPAAMLYNPALRAAVQEDFTNLGRLLDIAGVAQKKLEEYNN